MNTMTLSAELTFRANRIAALREQANRDEAELLAITANLDEHPEDFDGACACGVCLSYATDDEG